MNPGDMQKLRQEVIRNAVAEPPIQDVPYIKDQRKMKKDMTKEQIQTEAAKHYLVGSASYYAFIIGADWVLDNNEQTQNQR